MRRTLALELVHATESAAIAAARRMGRGEEQATFLAAFEAMHAALAAARIPGHVVVGPAEADVPHELELGGDRDGANDAEGDGRVELTAIPLEGTGACAAGDPNALSVVVATGAGATRRVPAVYMDKIAVRPGAVGVVDITAPPAENLNRIAKALGTRVAELTVAILDRPRHRDLIRKVRECGARIRLIKDGDVSAALATLIPSSGIDVLLGIGGALQGMIAATALRCGGGDIQARFLAADAEERAAIEAAGFGGPETILTPDSFSTGDAIVAATGVTLGDALRGVRLSGGRAVTHSMVVRGETGTLRFIESHVRLDAFDQSREAGRS
ncbi:MAG: fructose-bisphosphatase class II [bacterium]